jgi:cell cycle checkpoint protein
MAPPAKRRKRNVISSSPSNSEDEYHDEIDSDNASRVRSSEEKLPGCKASEKVSSTTDVNSTTKLGSRAKTANHPHNAAPIYLPNRGGTKRSITKSPSTSPEKRKAKRREIDPNGNNASLHTFFTAKAKSQQRDPGTGYDSGSRRQRSLSRVPSFAEEEEDIVVSDDDDIGEKKVSKGSIFGALAKKRANGFRSDNLSEGLGSSQKFFAKPVVKDARKPEEDLRPWAEKFGPTNIEELAVHKRKVADVRGWLENTIAGWTRQRLLVLKGAAGTGKTTTVQLLSKDMNIEVLEWRNPTGSAASSDGLSSMSAQFEEFIGRGERYGQLDILGEGPALPTPTSTSSDGQKRLILVEEFPNTFTRSSSALQSFRSTVLQYLAATTPSLSMMYKSPGGKDPVTPLVMVISETLLTTTSASADSFTAHRLLGPEILQHPGVAVIEFNAIAPTILAKALELIVQKESRKSGRRKTPGPQVLRRLGEVGDVRSAVGSLEFLCLRGDTNSDWSGKVTFGKTKKGSKEGLAMTKMEEESLELVTRREASLGIFHAVGKVVYNKRDAGLAGEAEHLADHLTQYSKPKKSDVDVDTLIDETGTDTQTFVAALHENYLLSCEAPSTSSFSSIDHVNGCIDALSDSDLLAPVWDGTSNAAGLGGGAGDTLRQDEVSFQVAVRGLLFSLPYPVKRQALSGGSGGRGGDAFKMFYPSSLKLWRAKEEIEDTIELWVTKLIKGDAPARNVTSGAAAYARPKAGSVETWTSKGAIGHLSDAKDESNTAPLLASGRSAKKEMLLERLPYMAHIARGRKNSSRFAIKDLEKVTSFHGVTVPSEDMPDEADEDAALEEWATDRPVEFPSPKKKPRPGLRDDKSNGGFGFADVERDVQKLVLSDDDIEDD